MVEAGKPCSVNYFTSPLKRVVVEENLQEILVVIIPNHAPVRLGTTASRA
jgi:hypothetical protein